MKKRIGIVAQQSGNIYGVHEDYIKFAGFFGTPVILLPEEPERFQQTYQIDALILPGGADVQHSRYSMLPSFWNQAPNQFLEFFDTQILPKYIGHIPIFGICRGLQTLNVFFGGTLKQHLFFHPYSAHNEDEVHGVHIAGQPINEKRPHFSVNSFHHQAVKTLGKGLQIELVADDGNVEAVSHKKFKIFAVQWHPERLLDDYSMDAFTGLLK